MLTYVFQREEVSLIRKTAENQVPLQAPEKVIDKILMLVKQ